MLKSAKISKAFYCALTALVIFWGLLQQGFTLLGVLSSVAIVALLTFWQIKFSKNETPAAALLSVDVFAIVLAGCLQRFDVLSQTVLRAGIEPFEGVFDYLSQSPLPQIVFTCGIIAAVFGLLIKKKIYPLCIGASAYMLVLANWADVGSDINYYPYGFEVMLVFTVCMFVVVFGEVFSAAVDKTARKLCAFSSVLSFCGLAVLFLASKTYSMTAAHEICVGIAELPNTIFSWWATLIGAVVFAVLSFALEDDSDVEMRVASNPDALFMQVCATLLLAVETLILFYFTFNWALFLLLWLACFLCFRCNASGKSILSMQPWLFMFFSFVVFVVTALFAHFGLFLNLVVTVLALFVLNMKRDYLTKALAEFRIPIALLVLVFLEALAWRVTRAFSVGTIVFFVAVFVIAMLCVRALTLKHPYGIQQPKAFSIVVTVFLVVICIAFLRTPIVVEDNLSDNGGEITFDARGDGNKIVSVDYSWRDAFGNEIESGSLNNNAMKIDEIIGDMLILVAKDNNDTQSVRFFFFPSLQDRFESEPPVEGDDYFSDDAWLEDWESYKPEGMSDEEWAFYWPEGLTYEEWRSAWPEEATDEEISYYWPDGLSYEEWTDGWTEGISYGDWKTIVGAGA